MREDERELIPKDEFLEALNEADALQTTFLQIEISTIFEIIKYNNVVASMTYLNELCNWIENHFFQENESLTFKVKPKVLDL